MKKKTVYASFCGVLSAVLLASSVTAYAAERPSAGSTVSDLQKQELQPPARQPSPPLELNQPVQPPMAADPGLQIVAAGFRITGQLPLPESDLLALTAGQIGKELSLEQLQAVANTITKYLQKQGYLVARAYLPAQEIKNGIIEIAVLPGRYDAIILHNKSVINDQAILREMANIQSGAYIEKKALERALWLVGDLAGAEAKATLAPGGKAGTSNLIIDVLPKGRSVSGGLSVDNYGNRYTGRNQGSLNILILNPAHQGDNLLINGLTTGSGLNSGSATYKIPAFTPGGRMEIGYSKMRYSLSNPFSGFTGVADTASLTFTQNFLRSRQGNLYGQIGLQVKDLYDDGTAGNYKHNKSRSWIVAVNGDALDNWGGGGVNAYGLTYTAGSLDLRNTDDLTTDQASANSNGSFQKWNAYFVRQQHINERLSLMLSVLGQRAGKNLDSSEKLSLGGPYGVRAYPRGEASGDEGYQATAELRWLLPVTPKTAVVQLVGFADTGSVTLNKNPWTTANNRRTLHGAGLGLLWNEPGDYSFRCHYAWKLGSESAVSDTDRSGRLWLQATKYF